jgi:Phytochelatin synthase
MPQRRTLLWGVFAAVALLFGALAVRVGPLLFAPNHYAAVATIERRADYRDPALMAAAWRLPVAAAYRTRPYEYQANPSFCGPASVANLLRSIGVERSQTQVIDGTRYDPWFGVLIGGLTLDQLADVLRQASRRPVAVVRDPTLAQFRDHLRRANDPARRYIVNFHRGPLFGRGHGHFSPVLGYLVDRDLVLVGDVNPDYRPFLVSSEQLWRAVDTIDDATGKERGLLYLTVASSPSSVSRARRS